MGDMLHRLHAASDPAADAEARAHDARFELMTQAAELRAQLSDASGIAAAIRGLRFITYQDAQTLIAALSCKVRGVVECDTEAMVEALDAAHDEQWESWDSDGWAEDDRRNTKRQEARGN